MSDPTQNENPTEGQPADGEELPEEALADQPEGDPEDTPDGEVDGGGEPGDQQAWEG